MTCNFVRTRRGIILEGRREGGREGRITSNHGPLHGRAGWVVAHHFSQPAFIIANSIHSIAMHYSVTFGTVKLGWPLA